MGPMCRPDLGRHGGGGMGIELPFAIYVKSFRRGRFGKLNSQVGDG